MSPPTTDLQTEEDVRRVVTAFYRDIETDEVLGLYFAGLDGERHLPTMVDFWTSVVFHTAQYRGFPFAPHARMPGLDGVHFERWLDRFCATVDAHYSGAQSG